MHIHDAPNGKSGLLCPDCRGELVARHGNVRAHCFAHWRGDECVHAGETAAHKIAKDLIVEAGGLWLPEQRIVGSAGLEVIHEGGFVRFDRLLLEKRKDGIQPDLIGIIVDERGKEHRLLIEILVTHKVGEHKKEKIRKQKLAVIEVDISKTACAMDKKTLTAWVLEGAPRDWVYHPKIERLQKAANIERERIEAQKRDRRAFAIAAREARDTARQEARSTAPAKSAAPIEAWLSSQMRRLSLLQLDDLLQNAAGDDEVFDVAPQAWRMVALWPAVPWRALDRPQVNPQDRDACVTWAAGELRKRGWVKPAFHATERDFTGHGFRERDFVEEACLTFLESFTRLASGYGGHSELLSKLRFVASQIASEKSILLGLRDAFMQHEVDVLWSEAQMLNEERVEEMLLEGLRTNARIDEVALVRLTRNVSGSLDGLGEKEACAILKRSGLHLQERSDSESDTCQIISRILGEHLSGLQERFEAEAQRVLNESLSVFRALLKTWPRLGGALARTEVGPLLQEPELAADLGFSVTLTAGDVEARRRLRGLVEEFGILAQDLRAAERVVEKIGSDHLRQGIFYFLSEAIADLEADHLQVIGDASLARSASNAVEVLERKATERGFGDRFVERALASCPAGCTLPLLTLLLAGPQVDLRKAIADVRSRREPPPWVREEAPQELFAPAYLPP